jgi:antitoxin (DNA-binding transcriptional repressor) of toxin-antitoxin stability system
METISIRNLRGDDLHQRAHKGQPVAITNRGTLIGVVIPVAAAWVEHLIDYNWSHVRQSIVEGEQAIASGTQMITIQDVVPEEDAPSRGEAQGKNTPERLAVPLVAALTGDTVAQTPQTEEAIARLQTVLNPSAPPGWGKGSSVITVVRIGDLTGKLIEKAGADGQTLALTHDRQLIAVVIPVTRNLVEFLIEQNMSRILYNIGLAENKISTPDKMTTLEDALGSDDEAPAPSCPALAPRAPETVLSAADEIPRL